MGNVPFACAEGSRVEGEEDGEEGPVTVLLPASEKSSSPSSKASLLSAGLEKVGLRKPDPEAAKQALGRALDVAQKRASDLEAEEQRLRGEAVALGRAKPPQKDKAMAQLRAAKRKRAQGDRMRAACENIAAIQDRVEEMQAMSGVAEALKSATVAMAAENSKVDVQKIDDLMQNLLQQMASSVEVSSALAAGGSVDGSVGVGAVVDEKGVVVTDDDLSKELDDLLRDAPPLADGSRAAAPVPRLPDAPATDPSAAPVASAPPRRQRQGVAVPAGLQSLV